MRTNKPKVKVGILGCGAIGSRIAQSIKGDLKKFCSLAGLYDIDAATAKNLEQQLKTRQKTKTSLEALIRASDLIVESCSDPDTLPLIQKIINAKKHVLVMSSGKLIQADHLLTRAKRNRCAVLIPSGAVAGIDAVKSAAVAGIRTITITTRKPPKGLKNNPYLIKKKIDIGKIKKETIIFDGKVAAAVKAFPQNINVAATLAMASQCPKRLRIRIITSPRFKSNSHEIEITGKAGKIITRTENVPCPDNPKTSYLAALSGTQALKQFCEGIFVGT
jgi:aspartate dehydrogenase